MTRQAVRYLCLMFVVIITSSCTAKLPIIQVPSVPPPPKFTGKVDVALVLGGGGSKAVAHVGVLEVLEKSGVPINLIVGTSAGSIIGALYADNPDYAALKKKIMSTDKWEILDPSIIHSAMAFASLTGIIQGISLEKFLLNNLKSKNIESLKIPLVIATTDIENNKLYTIDSGPIVPAVHASSAIPPFFAPLSLYGRSLIDGGVIAPVPVQVAKQYLPKLIIAVDISAPPSREPVTNMIYLTYRSIEIFYYELSRIQSQTADIDIHPKTDGAGMFEDHNKEKLYQAGVRAAQTAMPRIRQKMAELGIRLLPPKPQPTVIKSHISPKPKP